MPQPSTDSTESNPYAVLPIGNSNAETESEDVRLRKAHIGHEANVQGIGVLFRLGGFLALLIALFQGAISFSAVRIDSTLFFGALAFAAVGIFQIVVGEGLRKLRPWSRIVAAILSMIGLLAFPIGTLVGPYFLYLLLSKKGAMVFSEEYRKVIETTSHVRYQTPVVLWVILLALLAAFAAIPFFLFG